jgi:hypothetical protein
MGGVGHGPSTDVSPNYLARHIAFSSMLAVGEASSRSANPATLVGNLLIAIEARDLLPASLGERFGQRTLGHLVAVSAQGKIATPEIQ